MVDSEFTLCFHQIHGSMMRTHWTYDSLIVRTKSDIFVAKILVKNISSELRKRLIHEIHFSANCITSSRLIPVMRLEISFAMFPKSI